MLFGEQSIASLLEKHCFFGNEEFVYTFFNIAAATQRPVLKKFRTLFRFPFRESHENTEKHSKVSVNHLPIIKIFVILQAKT